MAILRTVDSGLDNFKPLQHEEPLSSGQSGWLLAEQVDLGLSPGLSERRSFLGPRVVGET